MKLVYLYTPTVDEITQIESIDFKALSSPVLMIIGAQIRRRAANRLHEDC